MAQGSTSSRALRPIESSDAGSVAPRRRDLSVRHAGIEVCRGIVYPQYVSRWAPGMCFSRQLIEMLNWYCALHRSSKVGYLGTMVPQDALVDILAHALNHSYSRRTLQRVQNEGVAKGVFVRSETYSAHVRQAKDGSWCRDKVVVISLTEKVRALWSYPTPDYARSTWPTFDPPSGDGAIFNKDEPRTRDRSGCADRDEAEGTSTEEPLRGDAGHRSRTEASSGARAAPAAADQESRRSPRLVAPLATLADGDRMEGTTQPACQRAPEWSRKVQLRPRGAPPRARMEAQLAILRTLRVCTYDRGRLEELVIARAKAEMDPWYAGADASGIDWDYYLANWLALDKKERKRLARNELIPRLAPASKGRSRRSPPATESPTPAATSPPRASPVVQIAEPPPVGALVRPPGMTDEEWSRLRRLCGEEVET